MQRTLTELLGEHWQVGETRCVRADGLVIRRIENTLDGWQLGNGALQLYTVYGRTPSQAMAHADRMFRFGGWNAR